jgi:diguanylate cyclase (GGDEF)-like protein
MIMTSLPEDIDFTSTPDCAPFGFDDARVAETISILGLGAAHHAQAEQIRKEVIGPDSEALVDACFSAFAENSRFLRVKKQPGIDRFMREWRGQLLSYGHGFDTPAYFADRLAIAATFARAKIPLNLLQAKHLVTHGVLIGRIAEKCTGSATILLPALECVARLTSLDLYLAAEGYRLPEINELADTVNELKGEISRLQHDASTDQLTGMMNYANLMDALQQHIDRAQDHTGRGKRRQHLCLAMIDLDHFKKINDTYGHVIGDFVLRHVAGRIKAAVRDFDMVGRFGGEEFVIIMADATLQVAQNIAERVRQVVMDTPLHLKEFSIRITISLGVAMLMEDERKESLLERADAAMYEAKKAGRNRVRMAVSDGGSGNLPEL